MKVLSVNAGSSSLKFTLFEMPAEKELISGLFEKIGGDSFYTIKIMEKKIRKGKALPTHKTAFEYVVKELLENNIIKDLAEIKGIGHRMVHGGTYFHQTVLASDKNLKRVESLSPLAPLHNPPAIIGVRSAKEVFPKAVQTLVFDTAFHQTMSDTEYMYPVPYEWYEKHNVRKYGFHGTSHQYVSLRTNALLGRSDTRLITCHLGNGCSISAIKDGKCVDTSLGMTPNAGLMMGTRSGDIDVMILPYMMKELGKTADEIGDILNKESGLLGVSGHSNDARDIDAAIEKGCKKSALARKMFIKRVVEHIAKYYVTLGGADAIIFTAGIGENDAVIRKSIIDSLACLGIKIDANLNNTRGHETKISTNDSKVAVYIIPTNEELMIAADTYSIIK